MHFQKSYKDTDDKESNSVSGLSTVMVATIQEAKDRISQIEYIFCNQLYPTFQSKCDTLEGIYSKAREAAEDAWKETEKGLLGKIEKMKLEKQQVLVENQALKEKTEQFEEFGGTSAILLKLRVQKRQIEDLKDELQQKCKEADGGMKLHTKLVELVQAKSSEIANKDKQLKDNEQEMNKLQAQVKTLGQKVDILQVELRQKKEIITQKTEERNNMLKSVETLSLEARNSEQIFNGSEKEKKKLMIRLEIYEENVGRLEEMLRQKIEEIEEREKMLKQLHQNLDLEKRETLKYKQQLTDLEQENRLLIGKIECLDGEIKGLKSKLKIGNREAVEDKSSYEGLRQEIELKSSEAVTERKKRINAYEAYKRLKSQYMFLCRRYGLTAETALSANKLEDGAELASRGESPATSNDPVSENKKIKQETVIDAADQERNGYGYADIREKEKIITIVQKSASSSPTISFPGAQECPSSSKSVPITGTKRPASTWRDTRYRQSPGGADPHDDFLDTPFENIKQNVDNVIDRKDQHPPIADKADSDDDETQDMNPDPVIRKQRIDVIGTSKRSFKYVEPVRKKAERDNLKGIECKQCKKFYDAVLPENGEKGGPGGNKSRLRCEHHEGVSRHRYKYAPPMTPEGFWNIGFESEM